MDNHITVVRNRLYQQLVPIPVPVHVALTPKYIVHQAQQVSLTAPVNEKTPAEKWDLQATALFRISNDTSTDTLPDIWHTLAPLKKEKSRPAFKISCRISARALLYKAPRVTHNVAFLFL